MKKVFIILFLISFCIALIPASCGVGAGFWYFKNRKWKDNAVKVKGTVVELVEVKDPEHGLQWQPVVEYTYQGKKQKYASSQSSAPKPYDVGDSVIILINPTDSKDLSLDGVLSLYGGPMALGIMTLPFAVIIFPICLIFMLLAIFIKKPAVKE
jgi:hypothetical protein